MSLSQEHRRKGSRLSKKKCIMTEFDLQFTKLRKDFLSSSNFQHMNKKLTECKMENC